MKSSAPFITFYGITAIRKTENKILKILIDTTEKR